MECHSNHTRSNQESELIQLERTLVTRLDVRDHESIKSAVEGGLAKFGRIDALVNNAGYGAYGPLEATPIDKIRRQFDVNVFGLLTTTQALLPHFRAHRSGTIINISSIGGRITFPLGTLYHGTKFAVEGLSESLHHELAPIGIRVKVIEPGGNKTDFAGHSFDFSNDPKLTEYQPLVQSLFAVLGPPEADYTRLTYDLTLGWAHALAAQNPAIRFLYVSGMGTGGKSMWGKVKGRTENDLLALLPEAIMIRLGALRPMHGEQSKAPGGGVLLKLLAPLWPILQWLWPNSVITTEEIGRAMILAARKGSRKRVLDSADLVALGRRADEAVLQR